jgi:hypothetical protein
MATFSFPLEKIRFDVVVFLEWCWDDHPSSPFEDEVNENLDLHHDDQEEGGAPITLLASCFL